MTLRAVSLTKVINKRSILQGVTLSVSSGEAVGLLGPNGAGKTTCFSIIVGLIHPDSGQVMFQGEDVTSLPLSKRARMGLGYLPQETSVFRGLNVEKNILAALEFVISDRDEREYRLNELLDEFSLGHLRSVSSMALSGGERRRVEIARALALSPTFILLDEPLAGIDPISVSEIRDLIRHLTHRGIGILITDHNVRETLSIVDRSYILSQGRILAEGASEEIVANPDVRRIYLGENF